jgi:hypothetical protein
MSDNARQGLGDKAAAALKPDSQKTTTEKVRFSSCVFYVLRSLLILFVF